MNLPKIKKILALTAITTGGLFTFFALLSIWGIIPDTLASDNKFESTFAILTAAALALLAIAKMMEGKK